MSRAQRIGLGIALGLLLVLLGAGGVYLWAGGSSGSSGSYDARGRVAGFGQGGRSLIVEHEKIPGYMEAMTMPFTVKDTVALGGLAIGDAVGFRLHTGAGDAWISEVKRLPDSAVAEHPAGESLPAYASTASTSPALETGDAMPSVALSKDQNGEPVHLPGDYDGQTLVLTFFYTHCPLPNYCPLMSQNFAKLQEMLPARLQDGPRGDVQLLSISFDPARDTPGVLRDYAARYTDDLSNWTFATGTPQQVQRVTSLFGIFTQAKGGQIVHNLTTAVIGPDGTVRELWRGNQWKPQDVLAEVKRVAGKSTPAATP